MPNWKKVITSGSNASLASLSIVTGSSNALVIEGSGSTIFDVQGSQGQLFSITDSLSGSLFSVNDISGIPILEVDSAGTVSMGTFGAYELVVNPGGVTGSSFTGSFVGDGSGLTGITATGVGANSVALGTDTTGNYVGTITAGTGIDSTGATSGEGVAHTLSVDVSDFMTNGADNRVVTATGTDAMNAEANLTFDGSTLTTNGAIRINKDSTVNDEATNGLKITDAGGTTVGMVAGADTAAGYFYMQSLDPGTSYTTVPFALNPNGGNVIIGGSSNLTLTNGDLTLSSGDLTATGSINILAGTDEGVTIRSGTRPTLFLNSTGGGTGNEWGVRANGEHFEIVESEDTNRLAYRIVDNANPTTIFHHEFYTDGTNVGLYLSGSGNVGIGTTAPNYTLDVAGDIGVSQYIYHNDDTDTWIRFQPDDISLTAGGNNLFRVDNTAPVREIVVNEAGAATDFRVESDTVTAALFVTASTGNVGFGTTNPDGTVHVHTATAGSVTANGGGDDLVVENSAGGGISILTPDANYGSLYFGSPSAPIGFQVAYSHNTNTAVIGSFANSNASMILRTGANTTALTLNSTQDATFAGSVTVPYGGQLYVNGTSTYSTNYFEGGTNSLALKRQGGTSVQSWNFSDLSTTFAGDLTLSSGDLIVTGSTGITGDVQIGSVTNANAYGRLQVNQSSNLDEEGIGILSAASNRSMRLWVDETNSYVNSGDGGSGVLVLNEGAGNVGIGITSPDGKLHVRTATAGSVTANAAANDLVVENSTEGGISILVPDANEGKIYFGSPTSNLNAQIASDRDGNYFIIGTNYASGELRLRSGVNTDALILDSSQNATFSGGVTGSSFTGSFVGDGSGLTGLPSAAITTYSNAGNNRIITSVDATSVTGESNLTFDGTTLSVTGTGNFSGGVTGSSFTGSFVGDGSGLTGISGGGSGGIFAPTGSIQSTTNDLQITGSVIISSNLTVEGRLIERSTRTLKENIQPLEEELPNVEKLNPVSFDWIESGKSDIGFIAEELNEVYPLLVTKETTGAIKGLHYTKLTSILVKAVQELSSKNKELESRVEKLETRLRIRF